MNHRIYPSRRAQRLQPQRHPAAASPHHSPLEATSERPCPRRHPRRWAAIGLVTLTLGTAAFFHALPPPGAARQASSYQPAPPANSPLAGYFQRGRWRADVRTLAAMLCYLVTPESTPNTNHLVLPA